MDVEEAIKKLEEEREKISEHMPWRDIAEACILGKTNENYDWLESVVIEYKMLCLEIEGMKEHPDEWKDKVEHPFTHVKALKSLLKMEEDKHVQGD